MFSLPLDLLTGFPVRLKIMAITALAKAGARVIDGLIRCYAFTGIEGELPLRSRTVTVSNIHTHYTFAPHCNRRCFNTGEK